MNVVFKRIRGRIVPIKLSEQAKDLAAGGAALIGTSLLATKARQKISESIRGKGKTGTGSDLGNVAADVAIGGVGVFALTSKFRRVDRGISALMRLGKKSK